MYDVPCYALLSVAVGGVSRPARVFDSVTAQVKEGLRSVLGRGEAGTLRRGGRLRPSGHLRVLEQRWSARTCARASGRLPATLHATQCPSRLEKRSRRAVELRSGEQTERHSYHSWTWPLAVDPSESKSDKENEE